MGSGVSKRQHCIKCDRGGRPLKFYMWRLSPASRAVWMLLKYLDVPYEEVNMDLMKLEHKNNKEFTEVNPLEMVPAIKIDNFKLWESRAIMLYIVENLTQCGRHSEADKIYPRDPVTRARIHNVLYFDATTFYPSVYNFMFPVMTLGQSPDPDKVAKTSEMMSILDTFFLGPPQVPGVPQFVAGSTLTVADFSLVVPVLATDVIEENFCFRFPNVKAWFLGLKTKYIRTEFRECNKDFIGVILMNRAQRKETEDKEKIIS